jgi:protein gp37
MQKTTIGWTDYTANPVRAVHRETGQRGWACTKVSPECAYCYAEVLNQRWGTRLAFTEQANAQVEWVFVEKAIEALLKRKQPAKVFVGDMTDLFHPRVPDVWLDRICAVAWLCPHLTLQVLTKQADRLCAYMQQADWGEAANDLTDRYIRRLEGPLYLMGEARPPLPNLYVGVTAGNQRMVDKRIPWLLKTPAAVRYLSVEPLLEAIRLEPYLTTGQIHHVVIGGESGPRRRPMKLAWLESLVAQCQAAQVPVYIKQDSALRPGQQGHIPDVLWGLKQFPARWRE